MKDNPEIEKDTRLAQHISNLHQGKKIELGNTIDQLLLKKYIAYAKAKIKPKYTDETAKVFIDFYVKMRTASLEGGEASAISITPRQKESLIRIAEARAKAHLREETTVEDAECAIALFTRFLNEVGIDVETGELDIDLLYSGKPRSLQVQLQKVLEIISNLETSSSSGAVRDDDLYEILEKEKGLGRSEGARLIGVLMRDGTIYSPKPGYYKRCS